MRVPGFEKSLDNRSLRGEGVSVGDFVDDHRPVLALVGLVEGLSRGLALVVAPLAWLISVLTFVELKLLQFLEDLFEDD